MEIIAGITSLLGGGLTGLIGAGVNRYFEYKNRQLDIQAKKDQYAHEVNILDKEIQGRVQVAVEEGQAAKEVADANLMAASYEADKATYGTGERAKNSLAFIFVDTWRGIMRPALTTTFTVFTFYIYYKISKLIDDLKIEFSVTQVYDIYFYIILWVLYTTGTVIGWWFGTRFSTPAPTIKGKV